MNQSMRRKSLRSSSAEYSRSPPVFSSSTEAEARSFLLQSSKDSDMVSSRNWALV